MAGKKSTVDNKNVSENKGNESSGNLTEILQMVQSLQSQINTLMQENEELKKVAEKQNEVDVVEAIPVVTNFTTVEPEDKIVVIHMQELVGGAETYIKLSNSTRRLTKLGQVATFSRVDFEELENNYHRYFEKGILALSAKHMDLAELYDLPVYDSKTQALYNAKTLKNVVKYNYEQLQQFYHSLSESNKTAFLTYWLGKVYQKEEGYYDKQKMEWLNTISNTNTFSAILIEMENDGRRSHSSMVDANNL